ncbi:sce7725 family protein [Curvivirga sp.]|uniref:sce7725 family protein n=1 Tax=Curvivirga sp. TaxID=2856848 RepID=UPI003B5CF985
MRGKQNELMVIRENASLLADANFTPIIEPVKSAISGLKRALDEVRLANGRAVVIVNPHHGELANDDEETIGALVGDYEDADGIQLGILLTQQVTLEEVTALLEKYDGEQLVFVHSGFGNAKSLAACLGDDNIAGVKHVFIEKHCGKLYQKRFDDAYKVLIRDGFDKRKNSEYPDYESFSDIHLTYELEGADAFGDFLIVGDEFSESGGPAYAVAIHITCIDEDNEDEIWIHHFKSDRNDSPQDPAGKFAEAVDKLVEELDELETHITETRAMESFRDLHARSHFPGLGVVKKLSMQHHIEMLAEYFDSIDD